MSDSSEAILFVAAIAGVAALFATKPSVIDINKRVKLANSFGQTCQVPYLPVEPAAKIPVRRRVL